MKEQEMQIGHRPMWVIAKTFNDKSKELNGSNTVTVRRKVKSTRPVTSMC
ncbi:MAG: hypothetical protein GY782_03660 [Gammaproteobacteria bacterium]|nr:hypothetical protein [Gammaproteobacteria bacterium]